MQKKLLLPLIYALVVSASILLLGVDIWFRNESGTHVLWFQNHPGFWDALKYPGMIHHYRPVAFLMLSVIYHLFGPAALPFILANFIGFLLTLTFFYIFVRSQTGETVAYFSVMALFPLFYHILYYPYNALHGIFYSWDVGWFFLTIFLFLRGVESTHKRNTFLFWTTFFALIAIGTHAFCGLTLAAVIIVYLIFNFPAVVQNRTASVIGMGISILCLGLIPVLEPGGGKLLQSDTTLFRYVSDRSELLARILMVSRIAPILFGGMIQTIAGSFARKHSASPLWAIVPAVLVLGLLKLLPQPTTQMALLLCLAALLIFIIARIPTLRIFALIALMGIVHYYLIKSESSNYLRFLIFGITPIIVIGMLKLGEGLLAWIKIPSPSIRLLPRFAAALTALILIAIGLGLMNVPIARSPVQNIRYLSHLSQTFRDALFLGSKQIPNASQVYFFRGSANDEASKFSRIQVKDKSALYKKEHLYNLRPAKYYEYDNYFAIAGRADLQFHCVEDGINLAPNESAYLFAFNSDEIKQVKSQYPTAELIFQSQRGKAKAAIFKLNPIK